MLGPSGLFVEIPFAEFLEIIKMSIPPSSFLSPLADSFVESRWPGKVPDCNPNVKVKGIPLRIPEKMPRNPELSIPPSGFLSPLADLFGTNSWRGKLGNWEMSIPPSDSIPKHKETIYSTSRDGEIGQSSISQAPVI